MKVREISRDRNLEYSELYEGKFYYRGIDIKDIIYDNRFGFEEVIYLLMFGELPTKQQLKDFNEELVYYRDLSTSFTRDIIMRAPSRNIEFAGKKRTDIIYIC